MNTRQIGPVSAILYPRRGVLLEGTYVSELLRSYFQLGLGQADDNASSVAAYKENSSLKMSESHSFVRRVGLEPTHPNGHRDLNPARLPIPPPAQHGLGYPTF